MKKNMMVLSCLLILVLCLTPIITIGEETVPLASGQFSDTYIEIVGARAATDSDGNLCAIVTYRWSHTKDDASDFIFSINAKVYENGIECDNSYNTIEGYNSGAGMKSIKAGVLQTVEEAYVLSDVNSKIEIDASPLFSHGDDPISAVVDLANSGTTDAASLAPQNTVVAMQTNAPIATTIAITEDFDIELLSAEQLQALKAKIDARLVDLGVYYSEIKKNGIGQNVVALQERLQALGYYTGDITGKWDTNSIKAMKLYEKASGIKSDGIATVSEQEVLFSDEAISKPTPTPSPTPKPTATPKPTPSPTPSPTPKPTPMEMVEYGEGQYKAGTDIPTGEYLVYATHNDIPGYFCLSSDSNQDNIITNDNFDFNSIITIQTGEYIQVKRAGLVSLEAFDSNYSLKTTESGCMLKVGTHIPAGEYKITSTSSVSGYYCIYKTSRQDDIIKNDNFSGSVYVTVKKGQYLLLNRCKIDQ